MIRQCAWCHAIIGQIAPFEDESVTHGMCPGCHGILLQTHENKDRLALSPDPGEGITHEEGDQSYSRLLH